MKQWLRPLSSAVSFYHLSHINNSDVFWSYTEPVSSIIVIVQFWCGCLFPHFLYSWKKKKGWFLQQVSFSPTCRLGSFSDSMVIHGSLPGLLSLVQWNQEEFCGFFQFVSTAKLSSLKPVIRLWQSHMIFIFKNDECVISIVFKSPPESKTKIPLLYPSGMWGALKSGGTLISAWEKHPKRESEAGEQIQGCVQAAVPSRSTC